MIVVTENILGFGVGTLNDFFNMKKKQSKFVLGARWSLVVEQCLVCARPYVLSKPYQKKKREKR